MADEQLLWMAKTGTKKNIEDQKKGSPNKGKPKKKKETKTKKETKAKKETKEIKQRFRLPVMWTLLLIAGLGSFLLGLVHGFLPIKLQEFQEAKRMEAQNLEAQISGQETVEKTEEPAAEETSAEPKKDSKNLVDMIFGKEDQDLPEDQEEPEPEPVEPEFAPHSTDSTLPANLIEYTNIRINDEDLPSISAYQSDGLIDFGVGTEYTDAEGIITFRGNNFRSSPSYGTADMTEYAFGDYWTKSTGALGSWTGSGWTGQPLMMKWPAQTKAHMNMYDWAKEKEDLVEVIYATMDGNVYFLDLDTGDATRDPLYLGYTFKGAGALDPRGYPIMYLGAGINSDVYGTSKAFIINLLDCSVMYTFGSADPFSLRGALSFFDSSALVDAETDTLIYPGENGILYLIKLNTNYNEQAGTLSINPEKQVKWRYNGTRSNSGDYWWGMEDSACIYRNYLFVADNGGNLMCLDLNTLELVWVQDVLDDTNDTPVLSVEDGRLYLYISTSFHLGWRSYDLAEIPIWKIDAETGEIVWKRSYNCHTIDGVSGGVQSTIALGQEDLSDYIYATVSMTDSISTGVLTCINKNTGEVVWEHSAYYAWSSPVCVYSAEGKGVVIYCTSQGEVFMLDGKTGEVLSQMEMNGNVEASPAVYEDRLVVGTRNCRIYGVQLK